MPVRYDDAERRLTLSTRDLAHLLSERDGGGHLRLEVALSRAARAEAGRQAHGAWQADRGLEDVAFRAEVTVSVTIEVRGWECTVRGRLDGLTEEGGRWVVEEAKSTALDAEALRQAGADRFPAWAEQVRTYLWMLERSGQPDAVGRLVLVSLVDGSRHVVPVHHDASGVAARVQARLEGLVRDREAWLAWREHRRGAPVPFPHDAARPGQAQAADAVQRAVRQRAQLLLSAPTGTGKTAAVLHGALSAAWATGQQVFVATAKGTQADIVARTLEGMVARGLRVRAVFLRARDKLCLNDVVDCRPEACAWAHGFYTRLEQEGAVDRVLAQPVARPERATAVGMACRVCPYFLQLEAASRADVVVGDYNYAFDPAVALRRLFGDSPGDWVVVVDEAHNLVDRARDWFSAELTAEEADAAVRELRLRPDARSLTAFVEVAEDAAAAVRGGWLDDVGLPWEDGGEPVPPWEGERLVCLDARRFRDLRRRVEQLALEYALQTGRRPDDPYLALAFRLLRFSERLDGAGPETVHLHRAWARGASVRLSCLDPSSWMRERLGQVGAVVLLSATLRPHRYHEDLLGLDPERVQRVDVPSPLPPEHRAVLLSTRVSTAWRDRAAHKDATVRVVAEAVAACPGNVAVYYSSHELLASLQPAVDVSTGRASLVQAPTMDEAARTELLRSVGAPGVRTLHAVLGGVFAEGIDLPAGALCAVVVVGPALPRVTLTRQLVQRWCQHRYGDGFGYAFWVPGITRVVQAAGRVIRRPEDRGVVVLVDRRFGWRAVQELLPGDWRCQRVEEPGPAVAAFWAGVPDAPAER